MNLQRVLSFPNKIRSTNVNRSGTSTAECLEGRDGYLDHKEFTPFMFICHLGLPQDLIISVNNRES